MPNTLPISRRPKSGKWRYDKAFESVLEGVEREINQKRSIPYHEGFVYVVPGVTRSICHAGPLGGEVILRIRTTDKEPDLDLIGEMQKKGLKVRAASHHYAGYPEVAVQLVAGAEGNVGYYEIYAGHVPNEKIIEAMNTVDYLGKVFIQEKEIPQSKNLDSDILADLLRMKKFPNAKEIPVPSEFFFPTKNSGFDYDSPKKLPYHEGLGDVIPGVGRSACPVEKLGYGSVILRIRTIDKEPDLELIRKLQENGINIRLFGHYPQNVELSMRLRIHLSVHENIGYYEIFASLAPEDDIPKAMDTVDLIGKVLLQAKELPHCRGQDSDDLADLLRMKKFPIAKEDPEIIRKKTSAVVSRLAQEYMMNPGALEKPMAQFLEVGDLADIALGNKILQDELRQKVKDIMGWQMTQNAGRMTVMDYLPIMNRICGALGIPNYNHSQN